MESAVQELLVALEDQLSRCPGCFGVGKVRTADGGRASCLVCEGVHKELSARQSNQSQPSSVQTGLLFAAAEVFVKRCPACFGIRKVWAVSTAQPCLCCARLHYAVEAFKEHMTPGEGEQRLTAIPDLIEVGTDPESLLHNEVVDDEPDVPGIVRMPKAGNRK